MLNERKHDICNFCYAHEDAGPHSFRRYSIEHFGKYFDESINMTHEDGSVDEMRMRYFDIRFSNICNFKCRTCGPELSSSWYEDHSKIWGKPDHKKIIRPYKDEKTFWEKVEPYMEGLEEIYFAGGEPLIMEEHYRILKRLVEKKMFHVKLKYNTNFSQMTYKDIDVMREWDKFENVEIGASLDASHKRGEFLRKGQSWEQVEANRKRMFESCPRAYFFLATCLDVFNSFHVPDFHIDWYKRGWIQDEGSLINPLLTPNYLRIQILPEVMKEQLREKYRKAQEWMDTNTKNKSKRYDALIKFLDEADYSHKIKEWIRSTDQLDSLRDENWRDIFPELIDLEKYK